MVEKQKKSTDRTPQVVAKIHGLDTWDLHAHGPLSKLVEQNKWAEAGTRILTDRKPDDEQALKDAVACFALDRQCQDELDRSHWDVMVESKLKSSLKRPDMLEEYLGLIEDPKKLRQSQERLKERYQ
ncbi:MAG: hypothetical protein GF334_12460 [Candidatus Altiarchaeales archaeon]|nr:hypothetical protein [Candidatus Altiarchaeales archaeon]